jgi:hypothetical protein
MGGRSPQKSVLKLAADLPEDRRHRLWCVTTEMVAYWSCMAGAVIHLMLYFAGLRHQRMIGNPEPGILVFIALIVYSFPITLGLVTIPSRIAMNLIIKDRRHPRRKETLILVLAFIALGRMLYTLATRVTTECCVQRGIDQATISV